VPSKNEKVTHETSNVDNVVVECFGIAVGIIVPQT
jgi:hypothetical protein